MEVFMIMVFVFILIGFFAVFAAVMYIVIKTARNAERSGAIRDLVSEAEKDGYTTNLYDESNRDEFFFTNTEQDVNTVYFYCDSPVHNVSISASRPIKCDLDEVNNYIFRMTDNRTENFFGLDNGKYVLQFSSDGVTDEIVADIPAVREGGSYQAVLHGIYQVEELVEAYFNGADVKIFADFELMKF